MSINTELDQTVIFPYRNTAEPAGTYYGAGLRHHSLTKIDDLNHFSFCFDTQNQKHPLRTVFQIDFVKHCGDKLVFWGVFFYWCKAKNQ